MKFIATLNTPRPIERPVQYYGPTQGTVSSLAENWLESNGQAGDSFVISEVVRVDLGVIRCTKPPVIRQFKNHTPEVVQNSTRCGKCNQLYDEHI